jgi:hypothetical protein
LCWWNGARRSQAGHLRRRGAPSRVGASQHRWCWIEGGRSSASSFRPTYLRGSAALGAMQRLPDAALEVAGSPRRRRPNRLASVLGLGWVV